MSKRTVSHALFTYSDDKGLPRMALRGQEIELTGDELRRAEELGAVVEGPLEDGVHTPVIEPKLPVDPAVAGELNEAGKKAVEVDEKPAAAPARSASTKK